MDYFWLLARRNAAAHQLTLSLIEVATLESDWHLSHHVRVEPDQTSVQSPQAAHLPEGDVDEESDVLLAPPQLQPPPQYAVMILNDDYTPMEFVIEVLQDFFAMDLDRATQVMLSVHHQGKGIAGIYPRDIAETKANQVNQYARVHGHPLLCQIEPHS